MFIANFMASVLALAMVGASTASVSNVERNSLGSDIVLNRDLHKAYYDPDGTYRTTSSTASNYSSFGVVEYWTSSAEEYEDILNPSYTEFSNEEGFVGFGAGCSYFKFAKQEIDENQESSWVVDDTIVLDYYINGDFVASTSLSYDGFFRIPYESTYSYIWFFDHVNSEPYTPVDMLGDIAEGITGGIVPVAEGIGEGLQSLVQDIFLNAAHDGLSVFGVVIICFAGLALALGLSRWVLNFVDTLGARDR